MSPTSLYTGLIMKSLKQATGADFDMHNIPGQLCDQQKNLLKKVLAKLG